MKCAPVVRLPVTALYDASHLRVNPRVFFQFIKRCLVRPRDGEVRFRHRRAITPDLRFANYLEVSIQDSMVRMGPVFKRDYNRGLPINKRSVTALNQGQSVLFRRLPTCDNPVIGLCPRRVDHIARCVRSTRARRRSSGGGTKRCLLAIGVRDQFPFQFLSKARIPSKFTARYQP